MYAINIMNNVLNKSNIYKSKVNSINNVCINDNGTFPCEKDIWCINNEKCLIF